MSLRYRPVTGSISYLPHSSWTFYKSSSPHLLLTSSAHPAHPTPTHPSRPAHPTQPAHLHSFCSAPLILLTSTHSAHLHSSRSPPLILPTSTYPAHLIYPSLPH